MKKFIISGFILAIVCQAGFPADTGTGGARFLRIGVGARPASFGESFSAVADDVNTIHWNPAGLGLMEDSEVYISHNKWFTDITEQSLTYAQPAGGIGTIGGSIRYLHMGKIESWDENDTRIADSTAYDLAMLLSWGKQIGGKLYSGANIKIIQQKLSEESAMGFGLDLGFLFKSVLADNRLQFGLVFQNIGGQMKFIEEGDSLPINIKLGTAYWLKNNMIISLEANKPLDEDLYIGTGVECTLRNILSLRAGYSMRDVINKGITLGFGIKPAGWLLDFAYVPSGDLDYIYKVSLGIRPGALGPAGIKKKSAKSADKIKQLYKKGLASMKAKKYTDAAKIFSELISLDPTHAGGLKKLEEAYSKMQAVKTKPGKTKSKKKKK